MPLTILIVEDEPLLAQSLDTLLARDGHRVITVDSAEAAIAALERSAESFDAVLSDLQMPGMGGEGLHEWMRSTRPELLERLVFMSGDLLSPAAQAFLERVQQPVLPKPFTRDVLRATLALLAR